VIDIADRKTDRYIDTLYYVYNALFRYKIEDILAFVYQKRPTLKYRNINLEISET